LPPLGLQLWRRHLAAQQRLEAAATTNCFRRGFAFCALGHFRRRFSTSFQNRGDGILPPRATASRRHGKSLPTSSCFCAFWAISAPTIRRLNHPWLNLKRSVG